MSSLRDGLNLHCLPSVVIREIIKLGRQSMESVRLISPRWNQEVLRRFEDRTFKRPEINLFTWDSYGDNFILSMIIPEGYQSYFGIEDWTVGTHEDNLQYSFLFPSNAILSNKKIRKPLFHRIRKLFSRCSHVASLTLALINISGGHYIECIREAMGAVAVNKLTVFGLSLSRISASEIVKFLRFAEVRSLILIQCNDITYSGRLFPDAFGLMCEVQIIFEEITSDDQWARILPSVDEACEFLEGKNLAFIEGWITLERYRITIPANEA